MPCTRAGERRPEPGTSSSASRDDGHGRCAVVVTTAQGGAKPRRWSMPWGRAAPAEGCGTAPRWGARGVAGGGERGRRLGPGHARAGSRARRDEGPGQRHRRVPETLAGRDVQSDAKTGGAPGPPRSGGVRERLERDPRLLTNGDEPMVFVACKPMNPLGLVGLIVLAIHVLHAD